MKLLHRNRRSKRGSSLPMVMAIGAALVVWVMALMPLMATSGTTAAQTKALEANYLSSKSSIEFVKGELTEMVEKEGIPSTFVVIGEVTDGVTIYRSIKQTVGGDGGYGTYVLNNVDDNLDAPQADPYGNQVTAICAVVYNTSTGAYDITITTYNKGEKGMVYTATYTVPGSLKIVPEAYRQTQALPLNDFVIVDGKKGALKGGVTGSNIIWNSSLTSGDGTLTYQNYFTSGNYDSNFKEVLLRKPRSSDVTLGYADVGNYPGVLKTTAEAARKDAGDNDMVARPEDGVPVEREFSPEAWILPTAEDFKWDGNKVVVSSDGQLAGLNITGKITTYYNGVATPPTNSGVYRVTIDFAGTGDYNTAENAINALPVEGLEIVPAYESPVDIPIVTSGIASKSVSDGKLNVTLTKSNLDGVYYGYSTKAATYFDDISWKQSSGSNRFSISIEAGKRYYFYCFKPGSVENGKITESTDVLFLGVVTPFSGSYKAPESGEYVIYSKGDGNTYYEMRLNDGSEKVYSDSFKVSEGILTEEQDFQSWLIKKVNIGTENNPKYRYQFYRDISTDTKEEYQYLTLTQTETYTAAVSNRDWKKATPPKYTYEYKFVLQNGDKDFDSEESLFRITGEGIVTPHKEFSEKNEYTGQLREQGRFSKTYYYEEGEQYWESNKISLYLTIEEDGVSFTKDDSRIYFATKPEALKDAGPIAPPNVNARDYNAVYGSYSIAQFMEAFKANVPSFDSLYANGVKLSAADLASTDPIPAGIYKLYVDIIDPNKHHIQPGNDTLVSWKGIYAGTLIVDPASFTLGEGDISITLDTAYFAGIGVADSVWSDKGGSMYYGYYAIGELESGKTVSQLAGELGMTDFTWTKAPVIEDLAPGHYLFAIAQSSTNNYVYTGGAVQPTAVTATDFEGYRVTYPYLKASDFPQGDNFGDVFKFELDEGTGEVTWWGLPNVLNDAPSRITLYHRVAGTTEWTPLTGVLDPTKEYEFAITVVDSDYEIEYFLLPEDTKPAEFDSYGEHVTSVLSGSSLYFMGGSDAGGEYSIDTHGNKIILTTDLLVIKDGIKLVTEEDTGKIMGKVVVYPYTENHSYTLMFTVKGFGPFAPKTFYLVPAGFNIARATEAHVSSWTSYPVEGGVIPHVIKGYFNSKFYPTMNADIAYTTNEQLSHIVSGEAIGWTKNGVLSGSDVTTGWSSVFSTFKDEAETNMKYVVCAYVDSISGQVTRMANRVMIAAAQEQDFNLNVTNNLAIWSRYLSLDAKAINKGGNSQFLVKNLADRKSSNIIGWLEKWFGVDHYDSDTVQVDYERTMTISGRSTAMPAQICRYKHNTNLFGNPAGEFELMVSYTPNQIESALGEENLVNGTVLIQERYVALSNSAGKSNLTIKGLLDGDRHLKIHSNYILFDGVSQISIPRSGFLGGYAVNKFTFNTQESGYSNSDYLWLFSQYSSENYHGVMLRFNQSTSISTHNKPTITIPEGFYFVPSPGGQLNAGDPTLGSSGMSIYTFAEYVKNGKFKITDEEMREFAPYINLQTGQITGAYVDTGLEGGVGGGGNTGFTGGGIK